MPPLLQEPSSPELALVDPWLAERLREAAESEAPALRGLAEVEVVPLGRLPRERSKAPVSTVLAGCLAAVLALGIGAIDRSAVGIAPAATTQRWHFAPEAIDRGVSSSEPRKSEVAAEDDAPRGGVPASIESLAFTEPIDETSPTPVRSKAPVRLNGTELIWLDGAHGDAYEVSVVRDGAVIYAGRTDGARLELPSTWSHRGRSVQTRPEDEVYVWRIVNGRRANRPIVDGQLALDMTPITRAAG